MGKLKKKVTLKQVSFQLTSAFIWVFKYHLNMITSVAQHQLDSLKMLARSVH